MVAIILLAAISVSSLADSQSVDRQERCEWQAQHAFLELKREFSVTQSSQEKAETVSSDYQSHYNAALNRCLLLLERNEFL